MRVPDAPRSFKGEYFSVTERLVAENELTTFTFLRIVREACLFANACQTFRCLTAGSVVTTHRLKLGIAQDAPHVAQS